MTSVQEVEAPKNAFFSEIMPEKSMPMPPMSRIGPNSGNLNVKKVTFLRYIHRLVSENVKYNSIPNILQNTIYFTTCAKAGWLNFLSKSYSKRNFAKKV